MQQDITLKLKPNEAVSNEIILQYISSFTGNQIADITGFYPLKQSIDARSRQQVWINLTVKAFINEPFHNRQIENIQFPQLSYCCWCRASRHFCCT
jgi:hypothetical protein